MIRGEFTTAPLDEPMRYASVAEGCYQIGDAESRFSHLITLGVYTCKVVTMHDQLSGRGLLAHIDGATNVERILDNLVDEYDQSDLSTTDVKVLQATVDEDELLWPPIDRIGDWFAQRNPKSIWYDRNEAGAVSRALAFSLGSGALFEMRGSNDPILARSSEVLARSRPLRNSSLHL